MALSDEFLSAHFNHFDVSFKEHAKIRAAIDSMADAPRSFFYVCPLCLKNNLLAVGNTLYRTGDFTKDHFPPQSAGGRYTILVCEKCNSTAGTDYDYILEELLQFCAFNKRVPNATLPIKHTINVIPGKYNGRLSINSVGEMEIEVKINKKKDIPPLDKWIESSKTDPNYAMNLTMQQPLPHIVARALLKAAYLYCFVIWGYEFVFSENGKKIRQVLAGEIEYPVEGGRLLILDEDFGLPEGLAFIQAPKAWQSFVVNIPLQLTDVDYKCLAVVPIPPPTLNGWEYLKTVQAAVRDSTERTDITMTKLPNYLHEEEVYGYTKSWAAYYLT